MEGTSGAYNKKYLDRWSDLLHHSPFKRYYRYIAAKYERQFAKYGYSLTTGLRICEELLNARDRISVFLGPMYCFGADVSAFLRRSAIRTKWCMKQRAKAILPEPVLNKIRRTRQAAALSKERANVIG
jgi:hypothetical protein